MKKKHPNNSTAIKKGQPRPGPGTVSSHSPARIQRLLRTPLGMLGMLVVIICAIAGLSYGLPLLFPSYQQSVQRPLGQDSAAVNDPKAPPLNKAKAPGAAPENMVWVPGGWFWMGINPEDFAEDIGFHPYFGDAQPPHKVYVDGFWMDKYEITNEQFAKFVEATKYETVAERKPDPKDFPGVPLEDLKPFSIGFKTPTSPKEYDLRNPDTLFAVLYGASWRHPEGPGSSVKGREKHPAVHICYDDALAYCKWAGKRLPTEAEWEFAARGGMDRQKFCWGKEHLPKGKALANWWQGNFPLQNDMTDGFAGTAPVGSYPANGYGIYDLAGNVWEWCSDYYQPDFYDTCQEKGELKNPQGPESGFDPREPGTTKRVQRGGSYRCADNYCMRYLPGARGKGEPSSAAAHIGFRCVKDGR